ncbi:hypothetical protein [Chitinimonas lacunae]|uniref:Uncharacterized protein n=1 Tax=Chitinimonas lacunae TaxID=1963018 RepID=A0ABV8MVB5_9NEIS
MPKGTFVPGNHEGPSTRPAAPVAAEAISTPPPRQGDHIFGNIVSALETALKDVFEGGQLWEQRFRDFNNTAYETWQAIKALDLGHGPEGPVVDRPRNEVDKHAHVFGGYAAIFQYEVRRLKNGQSSVYRATVPWWQGVRAALGFLLENIIDRTALLRYVRANGVQDDGTHSTISIDDAKALIANNTRAEATRARAVMTNYERLQPLLRQMAVNLNEGNAGSWDAIKGEWILYE